LTPITIATTGATGIDPISVGLPPGVTAAWSANVITISGTPTESGTFTYTILLTGGCGEVNATGTITVTPAVASACPTTVEDIDGNIYNTVSIGNQCWTKTNLKVTKYNDNTSIPLVTSGTWTVTTGAYTIYNNEASIGPNATNYGFLYNWYAVTDVKKICPTGWHVPSDSEWNKLVIFIHSGADTTSTSSTQSTTAGTELKKNDALWTTNTGTNTSGFSGLPGGYRSSNGGFSQISNLALFWSATENDNNNNLAWFRSLYGSSGDVERFANGKSFGASVRCLRD